MKRENIKTTLKITNLSSLPHLLYIVTAKSMGGTLWGYSQTLPLLLCDTKLFGLPIFFTFI
jgi:hypothetical protein